MFGLTEYCGVLCVPYRDFLRMTDLSDFGYKQNDSFHTSCLFFILYSKSSPIFPSLSVLSDLKVNNQSVFRERTRYSVTLYPKSGKLIFKNFYKILDNNKNFY